MIPDLSPAGALPDYLRAGLWGLVSGSGLLLGAVMTELLFGRLSHPMIARIMAFGSGVLIAVIATELVAEPVGTTEAGWGGIAMLGGGGLFSGINWLLAQRGARHRKRCGGCVEQSTEHGRHGSGAAIAVGSVLDGIPEALVIGMSIASGGRISLAVVAGFFIANVPQGLSSASGMKVAGRSRRYIFAVWAGIPLLIGLAAGIGTVLLGASATHGPVILSFAAGAVIALLAEAMIPEAFQTAPPFIGLITVGGFLAAILLAQH